MLNKNKVLVKSNASQKSVKSTMLDVLMALLPAAAVGVYVHKGQAVLIILASIIASIIAEAVWQKLCGKKITISDFSAVVTGLILSLILPIHVPLWIPIVGSIFATIIVKQFFGGVGNNFMNPAVAAKVFIMTSWASVMIKPITDATASATGAAEEVVDAVSTATEAAVEVVNTATVNFSEIWSVFLSQPNASNIGEISVAALLVGGLYLIVRRVISFKIPVAFIAANVFLTWMLGGKTGLFSGDVINSVLSGVLFMAAFFMANDPSSSPRSTKGQIVYGVLLGFFGTIFKVYGYNGEGAYYAIIVMNLFVPLIEKAFKNKVSVPAKEAM